MTDPGAPPAPGTPYRQLPPPTPPARRPPGTVVAAAAITWTLATCTLIGTPVLAVIVLWLGDPIFDAFEAAGSDWRRGIVAAALVAVALSALAEMLAWQVYRGRGWARWSLVVLSVLGGLASLGWVTVLFVPVFVSAGCIAVVALLLLPESRPWFAR